MLCDLMQIVRVPTPFMFCARGARRYRWRAPHQVVQTRGTYEEKNTSHRYGHEYKRNEYQAVEYCTGDELPASGTSAENVEPTNNGDRHAYSTKERLR